MKITIWSALSGKLSGHLIMNVPGTHTVRKLLETYCNHKGVAYAKGYVMRSRDNVLLNPNKSLEQIDVQDGDTLTLGLSDDEEQTFAFGSWWMVSIAAFFIGAVGLAASVLTFLEPVPSPQKFGIVMDAGSSHSEIFVFTWNGEKPLDTADVTLVHRCFMAGGVSSFATNPDDLGTYLKKCIGEVEDHVPVPYQSGTPFYVGATAGMRILRDFDSEGSALILATLREVLKKNTPFLILHENVDILEGSEEGTSGWIAVNYLLENLKQTKESTVASLDVGGASMQVTKVMANDGIWVPENLTLFKRNHTVLSQSFLCYGVGEAQHRYDFLLVTENGTVIQDTVSVTDPCLPSGVMHNITENDLSGPCTLTDDSKPVLSGMTKVNWHKLKKILKNYNVHEAEKEHKSKVSDGTEESANSVREDISGPIFAHGSSNASLCNEKVKRLFNVQLCKKTFTYGDCMNSESIPVITGDLVGFSGFFEHLMLLLNVSPGSSLDQFTKVIFDICSLNSKELYQKYPDLPKLVVEDLCFDAMFVYNLLTVGLGIDNSEWNKVQFTDKIDNTEVEWPLGFIMNQTTSFPADIPPKPLGLPSFVLLLLLFGAFLISGIMFLHHSIKIRRQSTSYQRSGLHQA